jgi:hypothetical protein
MRTLGCGPENETHDGDMPARGARLRVVRTLNPAVSVRLSAGVAAQTAA